jgi:HB1, ASXL, restriction endonuclease HTH domain
MEFQEAALTVLREEEKPLHWTVIQDLALQRGYLDPFTQKDIRRNLVRALADAASEGLIRRESVGVYAALPESDPAP